MKQYQKFLEKIATHIEKAKAKHPIFAKSVGVKPSQAFDEVSKIQHSNPNTIKGILLEEVYEFLLEAATGNIDDAIEEACDIIAVLIRALRDFRRVQKGTLGGFIESEANLSQYGDCWIFENARVYGRAFVSNDALVYNNATICGDAFVCDYARVYGNAEVADYAFVCGSAEVFGNAWISGDARLCGEARIERISDYIVFKNWWSSGRSFTWTRSNNMWRVGCFYGTGAELIAKAYKDSEMSGREYERVVKYVESIIAEEYTKGGEE